MDKPKLLVIAHTNLGTSLSGGDRIFLNIIKYWQEHLQITLLSSKEANQLITRFKLHPQIILTTTKTKKISLNTVSLSLHHFSRFISAIKFCLQHRSLFKSSQYIYTSSDFYGDFIFGFIAKLINPQIVWLCGYYLLAPQPFSPQSPYFQNQQFLRGLIYYLAQIPTVFVAKHFADFIFITSNPDSHRFPDSKTIIVQGGVYIPTIKKIRSLKPPSQRGFDAVYIGRLHSQKGIIELIDIWSQVVNQIPKAKLNIIGDGELMDQLHQKIIKNNLSRNVVLSGFCLGQKKFNIIKNSKIVLHPATYDSGGMAAAEAMAWGLPGVSFNLEALKTYYPKGMIKIPCFNQNIFARNIIKLLTNQGIYSKYSSEARSLIVSSWDWKVRLNKIFSEIKQK